MVYVSTLSGSQFDAINELAPVGFEYTFVADELIPTFASGVPVPSASNISPPRACVNVIAPVVLNAAVTSGIPAAETALINPATVAVEIDTLYEVVVANVALALVVNVKLAPTRPAAGLVVEPVATVELEPLRYHRYSLSVLFS